MKAAAAIGSAPAPVHSPGPLDWRVLLKWLRGDAMIGADDAEATARRFSGGHSAQHPLVRLGAAGITQLGSGKPLDVEALTEWLATRCGLPYLRIDPLRVDVGRVTEIMSITYAERRRALPITVVLTDVTIATCEPFDVAWVAEFLGVSRSWVYQAAAAGRMPCVRLGALLRFDAFTIRDWARGKTPGSIVTLPHCR